MSSRRRLSLLALLLLVVAALLLFRRCGASRPVEPKPAAREHSPAPSHRDLEAPPAPVTGVPPAPEKIGPASLDVPAEVEAGGMLTVRWTGPDNGEDFVTVVRPDAAASAYGPYRETRRGPVLELQAPPDAGAWEVRYVTGRSKQVLARAPLTVQPVSAAVTAPGEVVAGGTFSVQWRGPGHAGDYVTVVPRGTPDGQYRSYAETARGATLTLTAPIDAGDAEVRYMTGTGARVLARHGLRVVPAAVTLAAPPEVVAGARLAVTWTGPANAGDYVTVVPKATRDGQYAQYAEASRGSPLAVTVPIDPGPAEIRYMSGQGARVLARRDVLVVPARVELRPPPSGPAGGPCFVAWTGPDNTGDYLTIVPRGAKDGAMHRMTSTTAGSPVRVDAPPTPGPAEVRYMSGQGNRVLGRAAIELQ